MKYYKTTAAGLKIEISKSTYNRIAKRQTAMIGIQTENGKVIARIVEICDPCADCPFENQDCVYCKSCKYY